MWKVFYFAVKMFDEVYIRFILIECVRILKSVFFTFVYENLKLDRTSGPRLPLFFQNRSVSKMLVLFSLLKICPLIKPFANVHVLNDV